MAVQRTAEPTSNYDVCGQDNKVWGQGNDDVN